MKNVIMIALFILAFSIDAKAQEAKPSQKNNPECCATACSPDTPCDKDCCADMAACPNPQQCCPEMAALCSAAAPAGEKNRTASADAKKQSCKADSACCSSGEPTKKA